MPELRSAGIRSCVAAFIALAGWCAGGMLACAQDQPVGVGSRELWAGADAGVHNWLVYSGGTYAPWGDIHQDGIRLRSTAGYGRYDFDVTRGGPQTTLHIEATKTYGDAMIGYQARFGELTAKAFVGYAGLQTELRTRDRRGVEALSGVKGALELWLNIGNDAWASADVSYADTRETASIRIRSGYRVIPTISAGAEVVLNHARMFDMVEDRRIDEGRLGLFVRYEWFGGEISGSAGVSGDISSNLEATDLLRTTSAYGTVNWIVQF